MSEQLGDWRWYLGVGEDDDEMADYGTRERCIEQACREHRPGDQFWIVEARMRTADEDAMCAGKLDTAPFAETRNGRWLTFNPTGIPVERGHQ